MKQYFEIESPATLGGWDARKIQRLLSEVSGCEVKEVPVPPRHHDSISDEAAWMKLLTVATESIDNRHGSLSPMDLVTLRLGFADQMLAEFKKRFRGGA